MSINFKNSLKLKLTALSPIHTGSGEDYELTNYVIDGNKLYEFTEEAFYDALESKQQREFFNIAGQDLRKVYRFISDQKAIAKKVSFNQVSVLTKL